MLHTDRARRSVRRDHRDHRHIARGSVDEELGRWLELFGPGASLLELPLPLLHRLLGHVSLLLPLDEDLHVELVRQLDIPVHVLRPRDEVLFAFERKDDDLRLLNGEWRVVLSTMPGLEELPPLTRRRRRDREVKDDAGRSGSFVDAAWIRLSCPLDRLPVHEGRCYQEA